VSGVGGCRAGKFKELLSIAPRLPDPLIDTAALVAPLPNTQRANVRKMTLALNDRELDAINGN
jgi:hypothetical protein